MDRSTSDPSLAGRVCLVTGATSGLGAAVARGLALRGATLVLHGRDPGRCRRAARTLAALGAPMPDVLVADFADLAQVRRAAQAFRDRHPRLDLLVNNAGAYFRTRRSSAEGLERTFAVNHLAPFLLTLLLEDRLSPGARVLVVASEDHRGAALDGQDLQAGGGYDRRRAYAQSKLANLLFAQELARRGGAAGYTVNALCPGPVRSNLGGQDGWLRKRVQNLLEWRRPSPRQAAQAVLRLACDPAYQGVTGAYFVRGERRDPSAEALDPDLARRLWEHSLVLAGLAEAP